jgi:peptidoglycan/xylan/chitin deacetylase (PgdA/CDA1 family)
MMWAVLAGGCAGVVAAGGALLWYACSVPSSQIFGPALVRGPSEGHRVALTFDDGPARPFTEQILEILHARGIPATFFVSGQNAERYPEIVCRIHAEGHTLGNHTYSHPFLYLQSRKRIAEEIDRTQAVIEKLTGYRPTLFRPPYGARWFGLYPVLRERGMRVVQWSDTGYDWENGVDAIVSATLQHLRPGSVILLHDGCEVRKSGGEADRSDTVEALPAILDGALRDGLTFVSVQDFLPALKPCPKLTH